ncbi:nucleolar [Halobacteriales archaeon QS_1_68_20]|nr:MAG: nucleolar [Halobacteriales archaeon QS_1_68_20]
MADHVPANAGWFENLDPSDVDSLASSITEGSTTEPQDWPSRAIESNFADDEDDYYARLHEATVEATRQAVRERERADDQQLKHAVRAMDDCERVANELAERVSEWAGSLGMDVAGVDGAREVAARDPEPGEEQLVSLAERTAELADEADDLRSFVESRAPGVAPNLSALAGPVLAARLIALAGGLEQLAKMPSGTVQVLGAEDALFAHLRGQGSSPKHGVIFTHEYVRGTRPDERGPAARALAGKLTIAARVDHYSGERRPELDDELDRRIHRIRTRGEDDD